MSTTFDSLQPQKQDFGDMHCNQCIPGMYAGDALQSADHHSASGTSCSFGTEMYALHPFMVHYTLSWHAAKMAEAYVAANHQSVSGTCSQDEQL